MKFQSTFQRIKIFKILRENVQKLVRLKKQLQLEKKSVLKQNLTALNPLNPNQKVPVFFANFVLMDYGFGAVFGCPAHDQRDFDFAKKYKLNIKTVVKPFGENDDLKQKIKLIQVLEF